MRHINPIKAALSVGSVIGLYHLLWVGLVATGVAGAILDFVLRLHFLEISYQLAPFEVVTAATLVVLTFALGAAFGLVFAIVWNWLTRGAAQRESGPPVADRAAT